MAEIYNQNARTYGGPHVLDSAMAYGFPWASISHFICFFVLQREHTFWREGGLTMLEFTELCYKRMQYRWEGWHGFFPTLQVIMNHSFLTLATS